MTEEKLKKAPVPVLHRDKPKKWINPDQEKAYPNLCAFAAKNGNTEASIIVKCSDSMMSNIVRGETFRFLERTAMSAEIIMSDWINKNGYKKMSEVYEKNQDDPSPVATAEPIDVEAEKNKAEEDAFFYITIPKNKVHLLQKLLAHTGGKIED